MTVKKRRNDFSVACNVFLSYGVFFLISLWYIDRSLLMVTLCVGGTLVLCYSALVGLLFFRDRKTCVPAAGWGYTCFLNNRTIVAGVIAAAMLFVMGKSVLGFPVINRPETSEALQSTDGETVAQNMDTLLLLQEEQWAALDAEARMDVMKTVADIEANYLGIPELTVCAEVQGKDLLGAYIDQEKTISLNLVHLASADAETMLQTVCHECYHAYQHQLVDLYGTLDSQEQGLLLFEDAAQYQKEFDHYVSGLEDIDAYSRQQCEMDSERYAAAAAEEYYFWIERHIRENAAESG